MQMSLSLGMNGGLPLKTTYFYPSGQFANASSDTSFFSVDPSNNGTTQTIQSNLIYDNVNTYGQFIFADKNSLNKLSHGSIPKIGKHTVEFDVTVNSGSLPSDPFANNSLVLATRDKDADPSDPNGSNVYVITADYQETIHFEQDVEVFDDGVESGSNFAPSIFLSARPNSAFNITLSNIKVYHKNY